MNRRAAPSLRDDDPPPAHPAPVRFSNLLADPRHYRGDLRLFRTAIRRGWLDDAPDDVRRALVERFGQAMNERRERMPEPETGKRPGACVRPIMAECWAAIELVRSNQHALFRAVRYSWRGERTGQTTGRPRSRSRRSDFASVIDANKLRRDALAAGTDLRTLEWIVVAVTPPDAPGAWAERVAIVAVPDARYGVRVWLRCPRCRSRRVKLYPVTTGVRCRRCRGVR